MRSLQNESRNAEVFVCLGSGDINWSLFKFLHFYFYCDHDFEMFFERLYFRDVVGLLSVLLLCFKRWSGDKPLDSIQYSILTTEINRRMKQEQQSLW